MQERVAAAMASEEVLARIARRLTEERAKLEERVGPCPQRSPALRLPPCHAARLLRLLLGMSASLRGGRTSSRLGQGEGSRSPALNVVPPTMHMLALIGLRWVVPPPPPWRWQVTRQLAMERAQLLERKRREDAERRRQEEEMDRILEENRRKVGLVPRAGSPPGTVASSCRSGAAL